MNSSYFGLFLRSFLLMFLFIALQELYYSQRNEGEDDDVDDNNFQHSLIIYLSKC